MDKFKAMLAKKRDLKPHEKMAKMDVLKDMKDAAKESFGNKLDGMKKVAVMSNSPEGLKAGLEKAHDMVGDQSEDPAMMSMGGEATHGYADGGEAELPPEMMDDSSDEDMQDSDSSEMPSEEQDEDAESMDHEHAEDMDLNAIKAKIAHLLELQKQYESKFK